MEVKRLDAFMLKVLFLVEAGIVVTQVLNLDSLTSILFLLTFPLTVLLWLRTIRQTFSETDLIMVGTCVLAVISVLVDAARSNAPLNFAYLKKLIMFLMALLFFQAAHRTRLNEEVSGFIRNVIDGLVLFLIVIYVFRTGQMYTIHGRPTVYLTFCFSNPNMTALFLSCIYMIKMHRLFEEGRWYVKLWNILQQSILVWFILSTRSRNGMLVIALYTVLSVWLIFRSTRNLRISKGWATLFAVFPILLVAGYMLLVRNEWVLKMLSFLVGEGKKLDSRVAVWAPALQCLKESPIFGAYYAVFSSSGHTQMHNSHMDIVVSYGIPVLMLVCVLLTRYLHQNGRVYTNRKGYIYILGFACTILLGMGEAAVFSGGLGLYIMAGASLLLANQQEEKQNS